MAASLQEREVNTEISTAVDNHDLSALRTARVASHRSATRSNSAMTARTQSRSGRSNAVPSQPNLASAQQAVSLGLHYAQYAASLVLMAVDIYVRTIVNIFHVGYFSYRNPAVSKDLINTSYHLMRISYDNNLLTLKEIYDVTSNNLVSPMARQNQQHYQQESNRISQLETMKTGSGLTGQR